MTVLAVLPDGRLIVSATSDTVTVPVAGGNQPVTVTVKDLRKVEKVISVNVTTDPVVDVSLAQNPKVTKNVVGMTLRCGAGTTMSVEAIVLGF